LFGGRLSSGICVEDHERKIEVRLPMTALAPRVRQEADDVTGSERRPPTGEAGADVIEVGTPLIKSHGVQAVRELRRALPDAVILADMKTVDAGYLEARLAFDSGADIVTVLGISDDATIANAVRAARESGGYVEADLMLHPNPVGRAEDLRNLGVNIVGVHIGVDSQRRLRITAESLHGLVRKIVRAFQGPVSVAGGLAPGKLRILVELGVWKVVLGSAVITAKDPKAVVLQAVAELRSAPSTTFDASRLK
jgi:3-hexulose-6-phosphate synthase